MTIDSKGTTDCYYENCCFWLDASTRCSDCPLSVIFNFAKIYGKLSDHFKKQAHDSDNEGDEG